MGLVAASGGNPGGFEEERQGWLDDRRLRSREPTDLLSGPAAARAIALAQAYLAIGAGLIGLACILLPHPPYWNVAGLLGVQAFSIAAGVVLYFRAGKIPYWFLKSGPALATVNTTIAVYLSGDATSGFAMFYLWVGLYAFYFPSSKRQAAFYISFAALNYALVMLITPVDPPGSSDAGYHHLVIAAGTLLCAGTLLTYLRGRVERLIGRLTDAARTDPLTGLPNRAGLLQMAETEIERVRSGERPVSLMILDIDRFREVNRRQGVGAANVSLQKLGSLLDDSARLIDTAARSGGQEFAVLMPETDKHTAFIAAEELLVKIREVFKPPSVALTVSIGVASFPAHGTSADELFTATGDAVKAAKLLGRDRAVVYSREVTGSLSTAAKVAAGQSSVERQASLASALGLAEALDLRDAYTARHSKAVGELCEQTARELRMREDQVQRVRLAGILHDIGKIGVSDDILRKPGPLNESEWKQMRRHPELGARIISGEGMEDLSAWVLAHHERPDGRGYPNGLSGDEIPIEASVVAVCDAYEAMTSDRIYRPAIGPAAAEEELLRCSGTQFVPAVVEALLSAVSKKAAAASRL